MKIKTLLFLLLIFIFSCSGSNYNFSEVTIKGGSLPEYNRNIEDAAVGAFAPVPTGVDLNSEPITITTRIGLEEKKASIIVFLAHWCSHCQREVPMIQKFINTNGYPNNINLFGVATHIDKNRNNYPPDSWLEREQFNIPTIFDDENNSIADSFGLSAFPFWVFLNPDGTVYMRHAGSLSEDQFFQVMTAGNILE